MPADAVRIGLVTGIVTTLAPTTLYTLVLRGLPASEASILATWEPVVALLLAATVLGDRLEVWQWLGAGAVFGGAVILARPGGLGRR